MSTITKISDELWDKINDLLPYEKPINTIDRPIFSYRIVLNGFYMFLEPVASGGKCSLKNMVLALHVTRDFNNGLKWIYSKR